MLRNLGEGSMRLRLYIGLCGGFPKSGLPFGGYYSKEYRIWESILGSPDLGKLPYAVWGEWVVRYLTLFTP